jgi:glycosyltransferase involved in cell wall biosynthesis
VNPYLTVFIPAYNEESNLARCVHVVRSKMQELGVSVEVLIVDDGSQDGTGNLADHLAEQYAEVRAVHHPHNMGIGAAFLTAIQHADGEWMILIPADLALEPGELHHYLDAAIGADIVVGLRSDRSDYTFLRRLVSWTNITLIRTLFRMDLHQFQYISMYRLEVLRQIKILYWQSAFFLAEILIKARDREYRLVEVEILYAPRLTGKPSGARLKLVMHTVIDMMSFWIRWMPGQLLVYQSRRKL